MANRLGRMPIAAEVHALDGEVGGHADFVTGARPQDSAIVADTQAQRARARLCRRDPTADGFNHGEFTGYAAGWRCARQNRTVYSIAGESLRPAVFSPRSSVLIAQSWSPFCRASLAPQGSRNRPCYPLDLHKNQRM